MRHSRWTRALAEGGCLGLCLGVCAMATAPARALAAVVDPAENLVGDGLPQIPSALVDSAGARNNFRAAAFDYWHLTKRQMLISNCLADTPQLPLGNDHR